MQVFDFSSAMRIVGADTISRPLGAPYLEVKESDREGEIIAVQWRRVMPRSLPRGHAIIRGPRKK